ncbi:MAG: hypothetical protein VX466_12290 [Myxococcota bacterium]|nr:hypothetical protein [Myxococcota bacterium]
MIGQTDTRAGLLRVERLNFSLSAGAVAASFALFTPQIATSVAAGALVEMANFRAMHGSARRFFGGDLGGAGLWIGVVGLRLAILGGAMLLALYLGAHAIAFVAGLSIVLPAVLVDSWRHRPAILDQSDYPVPDPDDPEWDRRSVWGFAKEDGLEDER